MGTLYPFTLEHDVNPPGVYKLRHKIWQAIAYGASHGYDPRRWRIARSPHILMCDAIEMGEVMDDFRFNVPAKYADRNTTVVDELMLGIERGRKTVFPRAIRTAAGINENAGKTFLRLYMDPDYYLNSRLKKEQLHIQETVAPYIGCTAAEVSLSDPYATLAVIPTAETEEHELDVIVSEAEGLGIHQLPFTIVPLKRARPDRGQSDFRTWQAHFERDQDPFRSQHMQAYAAFLGLSEMGVLPNMVSASEQ